MILCLGMCWFTTPFAFGKEVGVEHSPNRSVPPHSAPSCTLNLPDAPTADDLRQVRLFAEPLIPVGGIPSLRENRELAGALKRFAGRELPDDFSALEQFIARQPNSPWTPSLTFDLAVDYYNTAWYSKALSAWEQAWAALKDVTEPSVKPLADRAAGELAFMYGRIGRMGPLESLLHSIEQRPLVGPATEKIAGAKQGLWTMKYRPEIGFRCGPLALNEINTLENPQLAGNVLIRDSKSTTNGFSLTQVAALARQLGMNYQAAYRSNGAPILLPAVVNWKVGHYAALLREENGLYLLQDPTFVNSTWTSRRALEAESSGYFLVPAGDLPRGWRAVSEAEGALVWGKGNTGNNDPDSDTCEDDMANPCGSCGGGGGGMAAFNMHLMLVSLHIQDTPVGYTPPVGPAIRFQLIYNQREAGQPAIFTYANLGPKWTFNWLAYITDNPSSLSADVKYFALGGGSLPFTGFNTTNNTFAPQLKTQALLTRVTTNSYQMLFHDGSKYIFDVPDSVGGTSRRVFLTKIFDPQGNSVQITYDGSFRVVALTDAIGQVTVISYNKPGDPLKISLVTDPFGRSASFAYDGNNRLAQITDSIGLVSQFSYDSGTFIQALTTPYGTNSFAYGELGRSRWLEAIYPNGERERVAFTESNNVGTASIEPANTIPQNMATTDNYLETRDSYHWDRNAYHAYAAAPTNYSKAKIYHWLHTADFQSAAGVLESTKLPLQNRVWYGYKGQPLTFQVGASNQKTAVGRVLDDGTTQLSQSQYNAVGQLTNSVDPIGRRTAYLYDTNLVDLLQVRQTTGTNNDLLTKFLYNSQHRQVAIWDAAGRMTTNTYNARGQLVTTTNPRGETTTFNYDSNGYLLGIDAALPGTNDTTSFSYDGSGRVMTVTGTDGYILTYAYDNFDRLTNTTYPDGTFEAFTYDRLDRVKSRDRMGRETLYTYDSLRQLVSVEDPLHRITRFEYCGCGSLSSLIDPMGRKTSWEHDIQKRLTAKQYADGSRITYNYENTTGRLKSVVDEKGQFKVYTYNPDDNVAQIAYPNAQVSTPTVTFFYDTNYNRRISMQDGIGTTVWKYNPVSGLGALNLAEVDGPWPNETVTYQYDELNRATNRAINGVAQKYAYDSLGRITNVVNALGSFNYAFDGATGRILNAVYPNGQIAQYSYFNNAGDRRLQQITHQKPDTSLISQFTYAYDPIGNITNWVQNLNVLTETWSMGYDNTDQLLSVVENQGGITTNTYGYAYDPAENRLLEMTNGVSRTFHHNALNEVVSSSDTINTNITYEWDAEQRLAAINLGSNRSEFVYDGLGRRTKIIEKTSGVIQSENRYVWCGVELCEEKNASNATSSRFFSLGEQQGITNLFYNLDHLGSVRGLRDQLAISRAIYNYAPFGIQLKLQGDLDSHFAFTGYFSHASSGLFLALYRAYSFQSGRWLSRDPLGERAGFNLYSYVHNNPVTLRDVLGLEYTEVMVLNRSDAAQGYGHNGLLFEADGKYYLASKGQPLQKYSSLQEAYADKYFQEYNYDRSFPISGLNRRKLLESLKPSPYDFRENNCGDFVADALEAGGYENAPRGSFWPTIPNSQFEELSGQYSPLTALGLGFLDGPSSLLSTMMSTPLN